MTSFFEVVVHREDVKVPQLIPRTYFLAVQFSRPDCSVPSRMVHRPYHTSCTPISLSIDISFWYNAEYENLENSFQSRARGLARETVFRRPVITLIHSNNGSAVHNVSIITIIDVRVFSVLVCYGNRIVEPDRTEDELVIPPLVLRISIYLSSASIAYRCRNDEHIMLASIEQVLERKFDFIVVGGGTCGIVVATRLSEDPDVNVLVLESGTENFGDPSILTPGAFGTTLGKPEYDWCYKTEPQESCGGRVVPWPRGKGLGGSSAMNFFMYHRPAKSDINALEKLGNPGWNWETLRKYYKKAEHFIPPANPTDIMTYDLDERGTDGPLKFILPMTLSGLEAPVQEALATLGIDRVHEPFSGSTKGTWLTPVTNDPVNLVRSYAGNMYLQPNLERQNLVVLTSVHVSKLVLSSKSGKITATGVELVRDGKAYTIRPEKEVILSAGTIASPQILELSGIGDKSVLERAGVPINLEIPGVGANLQEHIYVDCSYEIRQDRESEFITFDCLRDPAQIPKQIELFAVGKTGKNSVFGLGLTSVTFVPLSSFTPDAASLQEKLVESVRSKSASPGLTKQLEIQLEHIKAQEPSCELLVGPTFNSEPNPPKPDRKYLTLCNLLNHPISRGTIHIKSNNPSEPPAIDPKYFDEPYDLQSFIESFKFKRRLVQQEPLKSILTGEEVNAGPEVQTDEEIAEYCKKYFRTSYHAVGTCSMLPLEDGGVVDSKLKVYNTTNIRVVDVSIIPLHIGAHTQATAYAIAELAADIIKGKA